MALFTGHPITDDSAIGGSVIERSLVNAEGRSRYLTYTPSTAGIVTGKQCHNSTSTKIDRCTS